MFFRYTSKGFSFAQNFKNWSQRLVPKNVGSFFRDMQNQKLLSSLWSCSTFISSNKMSGITWKFIIYKPSIWRRQSISSAMRLNGTKLTPILDMSLRSMLWYIKCRHSRCNNTRSIAINGNKKEFFQKRSENPRVITATAAAFYVLPH
jgi:hypothetical protein